MVPRTRIGIQSKKTKGRRGGVEAMGRENGGKERRKPGRSTKVQLITRSSGKGCITRVENHVHVKSKESMQFKTKKTIVDRGVGPTQVDIQSIIMPGE